MFECFRAPFANEHFINSLVKRIKGLHLYSDIENTVSNPAMKLLDKRFEMDFGEEWVTVFSPEVTL